MFVTDYVLNGQGHGPVGETLSSIRFEPGLLRPYFNKKGKRVVDVFDGATKFDQTLNAEVPVYKQVEIAELMGKGIYHPVFNATYFRKDDWTRLDTRIQIATRQRLRAWTDLAAANSVGGFNAMATWTYEYESMTDPGEAQVDMEGLAEARNDSPLIKIRSIPLPITSAGFWVSQRRLMTSQARGQGFNTTIGEAMGRRVAETIEKTLIGVETGMTFSGQLPTDTRYEGSSTVYGYTTSPYRMAKHDLTTPTGSNPEAVKQDVIEMREMMYDAGFYGPFMLYTSRAYDAFLDDDYFRAGSTAIQRTTRERVMAIEGIQGIRRLDFLTNGFQMILVQMTPDVAEAIDGMGITTVQWESQGGARINFRILAIQVPLIKAPYNGITGIVHATTT